MADSSTNLDTITAGQEGKETTANALLDAASPATVYGRHDTTCSGLTWGFYGGKVPISGTPTAISNGTLTLSASSTNYIEANPATGVVSSNTSGFTGGYWRLYTAVTGSATVTSYTDHRYSGMFASGASGVVTSVGLSLPAIFSVSGSPVTSSGTLTGTLATQTANTVWAGPTSGGAAAPTFRALVAADLPSGTTTQAIPIACSDETTALTTGAAKVTFRMPYAFTVSAVRASLTTAQTSGSIFTVDINESGTTILSTKLTIDNTEKTSTTAATPAVISDASLADDAEITIDIDAIGDGTAAGLKVYLIGSRT